jgi:predicted RNase H-like HicB family nuclease
MDKNKIEIEYDETSGNFYIAWCPPAVVSMGDTEQDALDDLRQAAHFGIDTVLDIKLAELP